MSPPRQSLSGRGVSKYKQKGGKLGPHPFPIALFLLFVLVNYLKEEMPHSAHQRKTLRKEDHYEYNQRQNGRTRCAE